MYSVYNVLTRTCPLKINHPFKSINDKDTYMYTVNYIFSFQLTSVNSAADEIKGKSKGRASDFVWKCSVYQKEQANVFIHV